MFTPSLSATAHLRRLPMLRAIALLLSIFLFTLPAAAPDPICSVICLETEQTQGK